MFKKFFKNISVVPIVAGALAAVTSFLLSAKIGIGGSLIGVAVGSVVSAVSSQLYQNVMRESGRKLQEKVEMVTGSDDDESVQVKGQNNAENASTGSGTSDAAETRIIGAIASGTTSTMPAVDFNDRRDMLAHVNDYAATQVFSARVGNTTAGETVAMAPVGDGETVAMPAVQNTPAQGARTAASSNASSEQTALMQPMGGGAAEGTTVMPSVVGATQQSEDGGTQVLPAVAAAGASSDPRTRSSADMPHSFAPTQTTSMRDLGRRRGRSAGKASSANSNRKVIIVSIVSALIAVAATASIVMALTNGEGTDSVVRDHISPTRTVTTPSPTSSMPSGQDSTQSTEPTQEPTYQQTQQPSNGSTSTGNSGSSNTGSGTGSNSNSNSGTSGSTTAPSTGSTSSGSADGNGNSGSTSTPTEEAGGNTGDKSNPTGSENISPDSGTASEQ